MGGFGTFSRIALIGIIFSCEGFLDSVIKEDDINVCPTPVGESGEGCILYVIAKKWYISVNFRRNCCFYNEIEFGFPDFQIGVDLEGKG